MFVDRCTIAQDKCRTSTPQLIDVGSNHFSRCYFHEQAHNLPRAVDGVGQNTRATPVSIQQKATLLDVDNVSKTFVQDKTDVKVLVDVSLHLQAGETLGLVGESGSGKTTLARVLLGIIANDAGGSVALNGSTLGTTLKERSAAEVGAV